MPEGIILKGIGGFYYVFACEEIYECRARGIFRKNEMIPLPGDIVEITVVDANKKTGTIDCIKPRISELVRPAAANVNQVIAVIAVRSPEPDLLLLDKILITAELKNLDAVVCINKTDLDCEGRLGALAGVYSGAGYKVIQSSSKTNTGMEELMEVLGYKISVFAGQSGVGKSTLLNRIMKSNIMETGEISEKIERGKHTTRHAQLVKLDSGGFVVDTPGFSSYELEDIRFDELKQYYPDFLRKADGCRFKGCNHISEPDCEVRQAVTSGEIDIGRYERYKQLYDLLKNVKIDYKSMKKREK